jgi:hypothetical protein
MTTIIKSILAINPTAQVSVSGDDINTIVWENGTTTNSCGTDTSYNPTSRIRYGYGNIKSKKK